MFFYVKAILVIKSGSHYNFKKLFRYKINMVDLFGCYIFHSGSVPF